MVSPSSSESSPCPIRERRVPRSSLARPPLGSPGSTKVCSAARLFGGVRARDQVPSSRREGPGLGSGPVSDRRFAQTPPALGRLPFCVPFRRGSALPRRPSLFEGEACGGATTPREQIGRGATTLACDMGDAAPVPVGPPQASAPTTTTSAQMPDAQIPASAKAAAKFIPISDQSRPAGPAIAGTSGSTSLRRSSLTPKFPETGLVQTRRVTNHPFERVMERREA